MSEAYGLFADPADSFNLVVDENGVQGGASAYVQSSWNVPGYESQVIKLHFDLPDFNGSFLVGQSNIDLTVAKHLTVALLAQNTYMGDLAGGDPSRDMTWFVEGLGKFITGNDGYTKTAIDSLGLAALLQKTGQGWMWTNEDYAAAYLAVKYLDNQIRSSGASAVNGVNASEGIKHLTTWMKTQRDANAGASGSGLNQYIENHLDAAHGYGQGGQAIDNFLADFESANGQAFVNGLNLTDADSGSIMGSEYGGAVLLASDVIPDDSSYILGYNFQPELQ